MIEKNHIFYVSNDAAFRVNKGLMGGGRLFVFSHGLSFSLSRLFLPSLEPPRGRGSPRAAHAAMS